MGARPSEVRPARHVPTLLTCGAAVLLGAVVVRDPQTALTMLGVAFVGWFVLRRDVATLVALALVALVLGSSTVLGAPVWFPTKFALIAAVGASVVPWLVGTDRDHLPVPWGFALPFAGLIALGATSSTWSIDPGGSLSHALALALVWLATAVAIPLWAGSADDIGRLLYRMGLVLATVAALGLALGLAGRVPFPAYGRFAGILVNANTLGFLAAPILPPIVVMAAGTERGGRRTVLLLAVAVVGLGIVLSGSRGGAVASGLGILAGLLVSWRMGRIRQARRVAAVVLGALVAIVFAFSTFHLELRSTAFNREGFFQLGTGSQRTIAWADGVALIRQQPLQGFGFGATPSLFPEVEDTLRLGLGRVHSSYLEAGIDLGWPGLVLLVMLSASGIVAAWRVARGRGTDAAVAPMLLAGIVGGMIEGVVESGLLAAGGLLCLPFWLLVASAHSLRRRQALARTAYPASTSR